MLICGSQGLWKERHRGATLGLQLQMGSVSPFRDPEEKNEGGEGQTDESKY